VDVAATKEAQPTAAAIDFRTDPSRYKHWRLSFDGPVATLTMDVAEDGGIRPGYKLKLNSYDLGVDIELHDALQRIRFEYPEIRSVVFASAKNRIFCSGANIYMLGLSSHAWKVNFCKFTNETRNGIEDASAHSGLKFLAALNGTTAGGGYELALACDEIILVDDRSSAVSLPELPLLGVLPGTGGLTRITDKRKVRRDHADIFCTNPDGVRGQRAKNWRLVDEIVKPQQFAEHIKQRARQLAEQSDRPINARGVTLTPLERTADDTGLHYNFVDVQYNREARTVTITVRAPEAAIENTLEKVLAAGANWWPLQMARELCVPANSTSASGSSKLLVTPTPFSRPTTFFSRTKTTGSSAKSSACSAAHTLASTSPPVPSSPSSNPTPASPVPFSSWPWLPTASTCKTPRKASPPPSRLPR
jgi:benzoyl-CoA-dihydrodiol lyase